MNDKDRTRTERIIRLESEADRKDSHTSELRWEASQLIWEEVSEGTSRRGLAQLIGKSHTHVRYMFNCWEVAGRKLRVSGDMNSLPNFQTIYMSAEVRGDYDPDGADDGGKDRARDRKKGKGRDGEPERDYTASGLVATAANAVNSLAKNRAYWALLSEDELTVLRAIPPTVRGILRESGRASRLLRV
jgi:hypothetical protein